jgi:hypothetical protein
MQTIIFEAQSVPGTRQGSALGSPQANNARIDLSRENLAPPSVFAHIHKLLTGAAFADAAHPDVLEMGVAAVGAGGFLVSHGAIAEKLRV